MQWFNNMKIMPKLMTGFFFVALLAGLVGYIGIGNIKEIDNNDTLLYEKMTVPIATLQNMTDNFQRLRYNLLELTVAETAEERNALAKNALHHRSEIVKAADEFAKTIATPVVRDQYTKYQATRKEFVQLTDQIINMTNAGNPTGARALLNGDGAKIITVYQDNLEQLLKSKLEAAKTTANNNATQAATATRTMLILIVVTVILALGLGWLIARMICIPVKKLVEAADKLSLGDVNIQIEDANKDEIGMLSRSFALMVSNIRDSAKAAEQIAAGNLKIAVKVQSDKDVLGQSLTQCIANINALVVDANRLVEAAVAGKLDTRGDATKHSGDYRKIVEGVNKTLDVVVDKNNWYEAIIDAVPFPIHVTDNDMKWTFLNKPFEKLLIDAGQIKDRKSAVGMPCSNAAADICNTERCGIRQLNRGVKESFFDWCGSSCKQDTSYLMNNKGEKIGYIEVVSDLTAILKNRDYTQIEIERMADNLSKLAMGNLDLDLQVQTADEHTAATRAGFVKINDSLTQVKDAVGAMIHDAQMLVSAAIDGRLDARADATKHNGDYRKIVEGVNQTLEAIAEPINEVKMVCGRMAINDYTVKVMGLYKGDLYEFAEAVNMVQDRLLVIQDTVVSISLGDLSRFDEYLKIGKRCENDKIVPSFIAMMRAIRNLINETGMLAEAAINGNLEVRGDAAKFSGEYCDIINGFNKTLNAIGEPIKEATEVLGEMAEGNLCVEMKGDYKGSYALIKNSLNNTIQSFTDLLGNINEATDQVASGSRQVSDGSQALSQGATEQASSVEQLTVSISQVAEQTKDNAMNANQANELALKAKENAEQGNLQMNKMLQSMEQINESSSKISKIIKVIDEIAFQTNILALNAAVEAARAGQHGKGFAVVAEEVRNLAARSANAAKETTALIEGSVKNVEDGTQTANGTAKALEEIVNGVARAASLVGDIASASNEQATAIAQINKGVEQVAQVIQTNSATAEESAAASEELSGQADMLKGMISKFRLRKISGEFSRRENSEYHDPGVNENLRVKQGWNVSSVYKEVAATQNKPRIALSDREFGKY